jgi:alkanesulfonate monooxygenase SsuD/methylene tetrahydromethanopterin reductase-like flavin-dependent oxidoreductase (luciferase family)
VLGVAVGAREDDYAASGASFHDRGRRLDGMLEDIRRIWDEGKIGPALYGSRPAILIGGRSAAALRRVAEHGDGWMASAGPVQAFLPRAASVQQCWIQRRRAGKPRMVVQAYFALGPTARDDAEEHLGDYYGFFGSRVGIMINSALTTAEAIRDAASIYQDAGCDELILVPCSSDPRQLQLLREIFEDKP